MEESSSSKNIIEDTTSDSISSDTTNNNNNISSSSSSSSTTNTTNTTATSSISTGRKIVKIVSNEGDEYELDECVIEMCRTVKYISSGKQGFRNGLGGWFNIEGKYVLHKKEGRLLATIYTNSDQECILCFPEIRGQILSTIIQYCKFHSSNPSSQQIIEHDENLISMKQSSLCELASASYYLDVKSLVSLTSREIAAQISQKSSEEIRETFTNLHLAGYNQFFSSSKCGTSHKKAQKKSEKLQIVAPTTPTMDDNRSVDELLEFLGEFNGGGHGNTGGGKKSTSNNTKKNKNNSSNKSPASSTSISTAKNNQQQQQQQSTKQNNKSVNNNNNNNKQTSPITTITKSKSSNNISQQSQPQLPDNLQTNNNNIKKSSKSSKSSSSSSSPDSSTTTTTTTDEMYNNQQQQQDNNDNFEEDWDNDDDEDDDEIDPDLQEEIDKEVESFKQRLDLFNTRQPKTKLTLPSRTLAALLDAY